MSALAPTRVQAVVSSTRFSRAVPHLVVMRSGIDFVAHFDQQGNVVTGPETSIQTKDRRHRRRIGRILVFKTLQACLQPSFLSLDQAESVLVARNLLGQVCHALGLAGVLTLAGLACWRAWASLAVRSLGSLPRLVVG